MVMQPERPIPAIPRRPSGPSTGTDWGAVVASFLCVAFAAAGVVPFLVAGILRSSFAEEWAARKTQRLLEDQGVLATYRVRVRPLPLAIELDDLNVASTDGGSPALSAPRASVRPRFFALLSGKLAIDQIEVDAPTIRLDIQGGRVRNLDIRLPKASGAHTVVRAPFSVFSIADAHVDVTVDGVHGTASEIDLDVTASDNAEEGSSFEVAVRAGESWITRRRALPSSSALENDVPVLAVDDDALCSIDARFRVEPRAILIRRMTASGVADLDPAAGSSPGCHLPSSDKRIVELAVHHVRIGWPGSPGDAWQVAGHVRARAPLSLAKRAVALPDTDGWVGLDLDVRYSRDTILPDLSGHVEAHDVKLERYRFAQSFDADVNVRQSAISVPHATLGLADGLVTFTDLTIEPLAKGVPLRTRLDVAHVNFTTLMSHLGVNEHAHVAWDIRELHSASISGTLLPLHLDGDLLGQTSNFLVFDRPVDDPGRQRVIGVKEAALRTRVAIRPEALQFGSVHLTLPKSTLDGGFCSIGFHNDLRVDVPRANVDLADITPLANIPLAGQVTLRAEMSGVFNAPHLEADATIQDFVFSDMSFGNVLASHVSLTGLVVGLRDVKASRGRSSYEMPSGVLDFGGGASMRMDAKVNAPSLAIRDFLSVFRMEDDPRFSEFDGILRATASLHLALGGKEDTCGGGYLDVRATAHGDRLKIYGETFDDGDADLSYRWSDRLAGILGADVDLHGLTLHKVHPRGGKGPVRGVVLGSGTLRRGGDLNIQLALQSLPLSRMDALRELAQQTEGAVSGLLFLGGTLDAISAQGDIDVSPIRLRGAGFGASRLHLDLRQSSAEPKPIGRTRCGASIFPIFDKASYLADTSTQSVYALDGDLLGGQVHLDHVVVHKQRSWRVEGHVGLRALQLGPVLESWRMNAEKEAFQGQGSVGGELSGDLAIERLDIEDLSHSSVRLSPTKLVASRSGQVLELQTAGAVLSLSDDALVVPPLVFQLRSPNGLRGNFTVKGGAQTVSRGPEVFLTADLAPIDLGVLLGVVPKLERSTGVLSGSLSVRGKLATPDVSGSLQVRGAEFAVHGWPSDLTDVNVVIQVDANDAHITQGTAKFAGGSLNVAGSAPITASGLGAATASIAARNIRLSPAAGISAAIDADLEVAQGSQSTGPESLPRVTGEVDVLSFEYTRPINLEASAFGGVVKRTNIDVYDPTLDAFKVDISVKSKSPLRIKNNLAEISLGIDSTSVLVTGTDQRFGLRGDLKALPGGRFHLRANDFDVRQGTIRFEDPTRIVPAVDVTAVTEYRRYTETAAGAGTGTGGLWRITLHAYGDVDHLRLDMTSDPPLSQEDIVLLLTIGMTRAEVDQLQAGSLGASAALEALATVSGADKAVKAAFPVIDDFRFGSAYSPQTGRTEPQVIVGKHLTDNVRASVATSVGEDEELRANIEWRLNQRLGVQAAYDNINDVSSSVVGNVGIDLRWHLEFE
jgi:translocation and assembly module TamB